MTGIVWLTRVSQVPVTPDRGDAKVPAFLDGTGLTRDHSRAEGDLQARFLAPEPTAVSLGGGDDGVR